MSTNFPSYSSRLKTASCVSRWAEAAYASSLGGQKFQKLSRLLCGACKFLCLRPHPRTIDSLDQAYRRNSSTDQLSTFFLEALPKDTFFQPESFPLLQVVYGRL